MLNQKQTNQKKQHVEKKEGRAQTKKKLLLLTMIMKKSLKKKLKHVEENGENYKNHEKIRRWT